MEKSLLGVVVFLALTYAIVLIVTGSKLFQPIRRGIGLRSETLGYLVRCPMCFGLWTGLLLSLVLGGGPSLFLPSLTHSAARAAADGAIGAAVCWAIHVVLAALGAEDL